MAYINERAKKEVDINTRRNEQGITYWDWMLFISIQMQSPCWGMDYNNAKEEYPFFYEQDKLFI